MQLDRRAMMAGSAAMAAAAAFGPARAQARWAPYSRALAIDGAGGLGRWPGNEDGSLSADELADARASGLTAVVFTVAPAGRFRFGADGFESAVKAIAHQEMLIDRHPEFLTRVHSHADLMAAKAEGKLGIIYTFQETSPLGDDIDRVDLFHGLGVRVIQLTHNKRNLVGDGCMETGNAGLSAFGHAVVERLNATKVIVDLAHAGDRTMSEGIAASKAPMFISHTGCKALSDLPRCSSDANLKAMADKGGVAGMVWWPYLTRRETPMAADLIRHIEHAIQVCGEDHVGLGTDTTLSAMPRTPEFEKDNREYIAGMVEDGVFEAGRPPDLYLFIPDLNDVRRFEMLAGMLSARGHSDARIEKVLGGNFARVMKEVWGR
ncbi:MAG: dipeptidase [Caulobacteraceae bacterium]|nr:dipeptidase [Caulobacteraceae bacterium]